MEPASPFLDDGAGAAAAPLPSPLPPPSPLLLLHRDALGCIFEFLPLSDIAALISSCRRWPARDAQFADFRHPRRRSRILVRLVQWKPGHPVWDCRSPLRLQIGAVAIGATLPSALTQLRLALPDLQELHLMFSMVQPKGLEWSLPLRLEVLNVRWCAFPEVAVEAALKDVATSLPHLTQLTSLRLISERHSVDCGSLLDAVRAHPSITDLEIRPISRDQIQFLTRLPHSMRLSRLSLPEGRLLPVCSDVGAALALLPSLTVLDSMDFLDLSCLASLQALSELRIRFEPDSEEDPIWDEQSDADVQSFLFLEHLPRLAELRRWTMQLPARVNCLRKAFVGEILFQAIHRSNFHLVELDLCDWLLKYPLLASLLRLPALAALQTFRHRFTAEYHEDDDEPLQQLSIQENVAIEAMPPHPLPLPHLTELQVTHPRMTKAEFAALLMGMPSVSDLRLDSQYPWLIHRRDYIGIECVRSNPALARTLRILHLDRRVYQDAELQQVLYVGQNCEPDSHRRSRDCGIQ